MKFVSMKNMRQYILPLAVVIFFSGSGIAGFSAYKTHNTLETAYKQLQESIRTGDGTQDAEISETHYKSIRPRHIPEVELRILCCQWEIALGKLHRIRMAEYNRFLKKNIPLLYKELKSYLDDMGKQCDALLANADTLNRKIVWRAYNIKGSVRLISAFLVLQHESNDKKAAGILKEAVSDFKQAIKKADESETRSFNKNIPRWNLELLCGEQAIRKLAFTRTGGEQRLKLKENLEAVLPNLGGYAPGEPVSRKIEK